MPHPPRSWLSRASATALRSALVLGPAILPAACTNGRIGDGGALAPSAEDTGVSPSDGGVLELDAEVPDLGCRALAEPKMPAAWPFPATAEAYQAVFWTNLPDRATTCSLGGCHGDPAAVNPPLIPGNAADLANAGTLDTAIREIWARCLPVDGGPGGEVPPLMYHHRPDGGPAAAPEHSAPQIAYFQQFLDLGRRCGWAPIVAAQRATGPACDDAGLCDCPAPTLDLAACATSTITPDAGTPDAGTSGGD